MINGDGVMIKENLLLIRNLMMLFFGDSKLACIKSSDKWGYIDNEGKIMINPG